MALKSIHKRTTTTLSQLLSRKRISLTLLSSFWDDESIRCVDIFVYKLLLSAEKKFGKKVKKGVIRIGINREKGHQTGNIAKTEQINSLWG